MDKDAVNIYNEIFTLRKKEILPRVTAWFNLEEIKPEVGMQRQVLHGNTYLESKKGRTHRNRE